MVMPMMIGFEERTWKQGKVVTMVVPQICILRHPSCGAFLSHCGWNSVLEGVTSGVPIIALPQQYEQRMTARYSLVFLCSMDVIFKSLTNHLEFLFV